MAVRFKSIVKIVERVVLDAVLCFVVAGISWGANSYFHASVVSPTTLMPVFEGVQMPIEKIPNWSKVPQMYWDGDVSEIDDELFMDLPLYDPDVLSVKWEDLNLADSDDLPIYNAKKTYLAPYMGNYKMDGLEYAGSHLAVDIRAPMNTEVESIGAGVVVMAVEQDFGFGNHVVIKHQDFPSFEDPDVRKTYFSSYSHLNEVLVEEGDVVHAGDLIGLSGTSGSSSLPHLHFQIDNAKAPWHPYWPFTAKELRIEGIDWIEAIDTGFGSEKAREFTVHPIQYVYRYSGLEQSFVDVVLGSEENEILGVLKDKGVVEGYEDGTFKPERLVSRVEALKLVGSVLDLNGSKENVREIAFSDVDVEAWYSPYLVAAYSNGVVEGYRDNTFQPARNVSLVEFLAMIYKAEDVRFEIEGEEWFVPYVEKAFVEGLIVETDRIGFHDQLTRMDTARIIYRLFQRQ